MGQARRRIDQIRFKKDMLAQRGLTSLHEATHAVLYLHFGYIVYLLWIDDSNGGFTLSHDPLPVRSTGEKTWITNVSAYSAPIAEWCATFNLYESEGELTIQDYKRAWENDFSVTFGKSEDSLLMEYVFCYLFCPELADDLEVCPFDAPEAVKAWVKAVTECAFKLVEVYHHEIASLAELIYEAPLMTTEAVREGAIGSLGKELFEEAVAEVGPFFSHMEHSRCIYKQAIDAWIATHFVKKDIEQCKVVPVPTNTPTE